MSPDVVRAVLEAARTLYAAQPMMRAEFPLTGAEERAYRELLHATDLFEQELSASEPNMPYGFVLPRPWNLVPAGWFVRVPNGDWYEVIATKQAGVMQEVTLQSPDGKIGTFPRKPDAQVQVRRGTHTKELSDAIEALSDAFGPVTVIEDESPPWNP